MKKFVVILAVVSIAVCSVFSVSAASKNDLIAKLKEVPPANNEVFLDGAIKMIRNSNFTEDQIDKLIPLLDEAKQVLPENKGAAAANYTKEQQDKVFDILDRGCAITGYSYKVTHFNGTNAEGQTVAGSDFGIVMYDNNNNKILEYTDGIVKAGVDSEVNPVMYACLAGGLLLLAGAAAIIIVRRKNA